MALTQQDMLIRVPESEYKPLLDREKAVQMLRLIFTDGLA
jgi:hypothetical protein